ncbi:DUF938 domain-containing protein [Erythrobacter rubeus]|uniref:DUF938 domain-containing protein n=1 Tax=Erythrobacter rubeus TaxID=2760803 RepID=A0ABR8KP09_9SPHN|nr:DUF938 domain-containing protein [Erythrobacter rubeus]MBD2842365.1 DUF938 domain-containing protein [Erythrobacter rubeus]
MKKHAPATERNREVIAEVLAKELPTSGVVLEIASGSGEHAVYFARRFPKLAWQPSDHEAEALASIIAWEEDHGAPNLRLPTIIDAADPDSWEVHEADAVLCSNMVHISPWSATTGMFDGASRILSGEGAPIILYGPYFESGVEPAQSNIDFDLSLKSRDERWGIRKVSDIDALAEKYGFARTARHEMPANNLTLVYRRG